MSCMDSCRLSGGGGGGRGGEGGGVGGVLGGREGGERRFSWGPGKGAF